MPGHVVITGASRGIGRALALRFAARGNPLVLTARSQAELEALAAEIQQKHGRASVIVASDLGSEQGVADIEKACANLEVQGLVNNAGFGTAGLFANCDRAQERGMIRLNIEALTDLTHALLPKLRGQKDAFIINVASTAAFQPVPLFATYSATKAFVLSLSEALANELAPDGIHVLALCPGVTETGFQARANVTAQGSVATSDQVAEYAMAALDAKKRVAVHGMANALLAWSTRLAPRSVVVAMARKKMEPWFNQR
ncbi:MAG: SDR family oxidoreductase [Deltaproteobacteria bacterium]|nr:SDR family oxidoreductase [Deltaproteobacteria bacterium]